MDAKKLTKVAIKTGTDASNWVSLYTQRELAIARCAMHLYWCDDAEMLPKAAKTAREAIIAVINHFSNLSE